MKVLLVTIIAIVIDCVTGVTLALFENRVNSSKMREGGKHKFGELIALAFSLFISKALIIFNISVGFNITYVTCAYIFIMECISIMENIGKLNDKALPNKVKQLFEKLNKEVNK